MTTDANPYIYIGHLSYISNSVLGRIGNISAIWNISFYNKILTRYNEFLKIHCISQHKPIRLFRHALMLEY